MDLLSTSALFKQFIDEHRYLKSATPSTVKWYDTALKAFNRAVGVDAPVTKATLNRVVLDLRQRNVKPVSCNTNIKSWNAFCLWAHEAGHFAERLTLPLLRTEKRILVTLTDAQMRALPEREADDV